MPEYKPESGSRPLSRLSPIDRHVGARILALRRAHGISQAQLGTRLGISFRQIQKYEYGIDRVGAARLFMIAHVFDVAVTTFFDGLA